jgi:GNAT superfamily N-acetyltransferase
MAVLRFARDLSLKDLSLEAEGRHVACPAIRQLVMPRDRAALATLAEEARAGTVSFTASGLMAELESREGREVTAWLAWQSATLGPRPVGVVMVAETSAGLSIPWLLVDPDVRRQGVARALVAEALAHARYKGASSITAETLDSWPEAVAFWPAVGFAQVNAAADVD